jgi:hypothetical protein
MRTGIKTINNIVIQEVIIKKVNSSSNEITPGY